MFGKVIYFILWIGLALLVGCKGGNSPADKSRTASFEEFFQSSFVGKTSSELNVNLSNLVHPTVGIYFIHRPGSVAEVRWFRNWQSVLTTNEMNQLLVMLGCQPQNAPLPEFDCMNEFSKRGCFYQHQSSSSWIWNKLNKLRKSSILELSDREAATAQKSDSLTSISMVITEAYVRMHFGKIEGKWYLLLIDHEDFDCSL